MTHSIERADLHHRFRLEAVESWAEYPKTGLHRNGFVHAENALTRIAGIHMQAERARVRHIARRRGGAGMQLLAERRRLLTHDGTSAERQQDGKRQARQPAPRGRGNERHGKPQTQVNRAFTLNGSGAVGYMSDGVGQGQIAIAPSLDHGEARFRETSP